MRSLRFLLGTCAFIAIVAPAITTFIAIGYALKIIAVLAAVVGVIVTLCFALWAAIHEFVIEPLFKKKAPK